MTINGSEFAKIQINETTDKTPDGKILRNSLMINVREDSVQKAVRMYRDLKRKLESKEENPKNPERKTKGAERGKKSVEAKSEIPNCPKCNSLMILRANGKTGENFWSCVQFPLCNGTRRLVAKKELNVPCDEDLMIVR